MIGILASLLFALYHILIKGMVEPGPVYNALTAFLLAWHLAATVVLGIFMVLVTAGIDGPKRFFAHDLGFVGQGRVGIGAWLIFIGERISFLSGGFLLYISYNLDKASWNITSMVFGIILFGLGLFIQSLHDKGLTSS